MKMILTNLNMIDNMEKEILKLETYLGTRQIASLKIATSLRRSVAIFSAIHQIVEDYNSTQENEDIVCELLLNLVDKYLNTDKEKVFEELIKTIERNAVDNQATITNVKLWADSWRKEWEAVESLNQQNDSKGPEGEGKQIPLCNDIKLIDGKIY